MRALFIRLAWLAAGALAALTALECVFRLLPVNKGLARTEQLQRWPLQGYRPGQSYTYSRGWQMLNVQSGTTNNYGHIAPFDYRQRSRPVIVIGDSYVEGLMNAYGDTVQGQLAERPGLGESVYGLGFSGLSTGDYLALARLAREEFAPRSAVFVIFNGDFSESLLARPGYYHFVPEGESFRLAYIAPQGEKPLKAVRTIVTGLSFYRYLFGNLGFSFDDVLAFGRTARQAGAGGGGGEADAQLQRGVIDYFLAELPRALDVSPRCIVFLMDADRYAIYNPKLASVPKEAPQVWRHFLEQAQERGYAVSDLDPVFRARYAADHAKFDYWPNDRHWNRLGHGVAADEAYRLLSAAGKQECLPHVSSHR